MVNVAKIVNIFILVGFLVSWIIMLAGIAKVEDTCVKAYNGENTGYGGVSFGVPGNAGNNANNANNNAAAAANNIANNLQDILNNIGHRKMLASERALLKFSKVEDCGMQLSLFWWIIFFELMAIIGAFLLAFGILAKFKPVVAAFFYMVTPLLCIMAYWAVGTSYVSNMTEVDSDYFDGTKVTSAGTVAILIFNFLWILVNISEDTRLQTQVGGASAARVSSSGASPAAK